MFANSRRFIVAVVLLGACSLAGAGCSSSNSPGVGSGGAGGGGGVTAASGGSAGTGGSSANGSPSDAGDAGPASDLTKPGPYAVGHVSYMLSDTTVYARPVAVSVWYPVDSGTITSATLPAQYPLDPFSNNLPVSTSADWEAAGYDRAYEEPTPSGAGPFPLVMVSPGSNTDNWQYLYIGTRLASHGFVVAVTDHENEGQWPWSSKDEMMVMMFNRTRDVSFAITELLLKNNNVGETLHGTIDPLRIAMSGHSLGGYATYALVGGDDENCDALAPVLYGWESLPYPQSTCGPTLPDPRIRAVVALDGFSSVLHYHELARISLPSLIIGETVEHLVSYNLFWTSNPNFGQWNVRPHAAINRSDSYRVDVTIANHMSFSIYCDLFSVLDRLGVANTNDEYGSPTAWPCVAQGTTFNPANDPTTRQIVTTYMLGFLNTYFGIEDDAWMLTSSYATQDQPNVEFFDSEQCDAPLPIDASLPSQDYYTYQPHPGECLTAEKDPADYFAPPVSDGGTP